MKVKSLGMGSDKGLAKAVADREKKAAELGKSGERSAKAIGSLLASEEAATAKEKAELEAALAKFDAGAAGLVAQLAAVEGLADQEKPAGELEKALKTLDGSAWPKQITSLGSSIEVHPPSEVLCQVQSPSI